jgi:hypothetical protein
MAEDKKKKNEITNGIWILTKKFIILVWQFIISIPSCLNRYASLTVAIATFVLAGVTGLYLHEAREMTAQTKRLADISIEQFKVKSYPSIRMTNEILSIDSKHFHEKYSLINEGDITAFNCTSLLFHVFLDKGKFNYIAEMGTYYSGQDKVTSLDYSKNISHREHLHLELQSNYGKFSLDKLKYSILFVRFKVPYDEKFRYETVAWYLAKSPKMKGTTQVSYRWMLFTDADIEQQRERCVQIVRNQNSEMLKDETSRRVTQFFKDSDEFDPRKYLGPARDWMK